MAIPFDKWLEVYQQKIKLSSAIPNTVDSGEAEAIALALELNMILLIDEKRGRIVAKQKAVDIIGTAGILLLAKRKGIARRVKNRQINSGTKSKIMQNI